MPRPLDPNLYYQIAATILEATNAFDAEQALEENLPSAAELARLFNARLERVKKDLRQLKQDGLIHAMSVSPKRYRFDRYVLKHLDEDHPLATLNDF